MPEYDPQTKERNPYLGEIRSIIELPEYDPQTGERNPYLEEIRSIMEPVEPVAPTTKYLYEGENPSPRQPDPKKHQLISFIKSGIRISGYICLPFDLTTACIILVFSELVGILEELV